MAEGKYHEWLTEEGLIKIEGWARNGLTDEQIAHNMGISRTTFYQYKKDYIDISNALKKGKEVIDLMVENALLKRALGYEYTETTKEMGGTIKEVVKQVAPDTTAQIFWLKNRKPQDWRDKQQIEHSGSMKTDVKIDLSKYTVEELKNLEQLANKSTS